MVEHAVLNALLKCGFCRQTFSVRLTAGRKIVRLWDWFWASSSGEADPPSAWQAKGFLI
jgi:hypothetical protein